VVTMDPPSIRWKPRGVYACFLSHYKMEAASDARYMHDLLRNMLQAPVFLDSSALADLRKLTTEGVHKSDTLLMLATQGILMRPWCLIEVLEATRQGIPIVIVTMANGGFTFEKARHFVNQLEEDMATLNPSGFELLRQLVGIDLTELKEACRRALDANEHAPLVFSAHAGDNAMIAVMKDVVERMAEVTGRSVTWMGDKKGPSSPRRLKRATTHSKPCVSLPASSSSIDEGQGGGTESADEEEYEDTADAKGRAFFVCCARADAIVQARILRSELEMRLGHGCVVGGSSSSAELLADCSAIVVLLTKRLPTDPNALFEIWSALQLNLPIVTVIVSGAGYSFEEAAATFAELPMALERARPGSSEQLLQRLPKGSDVAAIGHVLQASVTAIIAIPWAPHNGMNHMDAVVGDILQRVPQHTRRSGILSKMKPSSSAPMLRMIKSSSTSSTAVTKGGRVALRSKGSREDMKSMGQSSPAVAVVHCDSGQDAAGLPTRSVPAAHRDQRRAANESPRSLSK